MLPTLDTTITHTRLHNRLLTKKFFQLHSTQDQILQERTPFIKNEPHLLKDDANIIKLIALHFISL